MNWELKLIIILIVVIVGLVLLTRYLWRRTAYLSDGIKEITSKKQSLSTKYGRLTEQFIPLLESYPYDEYNFRFLGNPIDGIQFEPDKIIFIEFKSSNSRLSPKQKQIKNLIESGQIEFEEHRISDKENNAP